jgi:UDP-N-acetylglucosamine--N-acetylmuramyl-(pentapeptide) pyrophosphoryl-undecaprenol N-acetylglucosamine transferase
MTNRILKWFSQRSLFPSKKQEYHKKTVVTEPIQKRIFDSKEDQEVMREKSIYSAYLRRSAGAHRINQALIEALDHLQGKKSFLKIIHQTGKGDLDFVSEAYREKGFDAWVRPFFEDMAPLYQISDLVICRSGASTVAELAVCGKAALLIPYPYAAHHHQWINAKKLVDLGAARMILDQELNGRVIAQTILQLYDHPEERLRMEETIHRLGKPRAAEEIVDHCYKLLGRME